MFTWDNMNMDRLPRVHAACGLTPRGTTGQDAVSLTYQGLHPMNHTNEIDCVILLSLKFQELNYLRRKVIWASSDNGKTTCQYFGK